MISNQKWMLHGALSLAVVVSAAEVRAQKLETPGSPAAEAAPATSSSGPTGFGDSGQFVLSAERLLGSPTATGPAAPNSNSFTLARAAARHERRRLRSAPRRVRRFRHRSRSAWVARCRSSGHPRATAAGRVSRSRPNWLRNDGRPLAGRLAAARCHLSSTPRTERKYLALTVEGLADHRGRVPPGDHVRPHSRPGSHRQRRGPRSKHHGRRLLRAGDPVLRRQARRLPRGVRPRAA